MKLVVGLALLMLLAPAAQADTALLQQAKSQRSCLLNTAKKPRLTVCGAHYLSALLGVNARRADYPIAVGISRASGRPIEACLCGAKKLTASALAKAKIARRPFTDWWKNPRTPAGRRLKGCLKNAALAFAATLAHYYATRGRDWNDSEALWGAALGCGFGAVVDA